MARKGRHHQHLRLRSAVAEMKQLAERLVGSDVVLAEVPGWLRVSPREAQEQIARRGYAPRHRQMRERTERMIEPAVCELRPKSPWSERRVLGFVEAVEHP